MRRIGKSPHLASPYMAKCKRIRTDGPTPCYCCPGECVGEVDLPLETQEDFYQQMARDIGRRRVVPRITVKGFVVWALLTALAVLAIGLSGRHTDKRDPRCDTPARYDAMRDGADCS